MWFAKVIAGQLCIELGLVDMLVYERWPTKDERDGNGQSSVAPIVCNSNPFPLHEGVCSHIASDPLARHSSFAPLGFCLSLECRSAKPWRTPRS